jgi:nitrate reductase gamma subunit
MNWNETLEFARGPFFRIALVVFVGGMAYRLVRVLALGWTRDRVPTKGSKIKGVVTTYLKGIIIWPFLPWVRNTFSKKPVMYLAGGLFHLGLFVIIFFGTPHMLVWKSLLGPGWATLPVPIVDWFAAVTIIAMVGLLINRFVDPVLKLITGAAEILNWLVVFVPMVTGYLMTHHLINPYEAIFSLHVLAVDLLLIWIPFSRISHFMFYFFSRTIHGAQFGKRAVTP